MRRRVASSGNRPLPAAMLSTRCFGLLVAGMTQVTAGFARSVLEKKLRPGRAVEVRGPRRQRRVAHAREEVALREGAVHDHGHAALRRERQDRLLRGAFPDGIIELHEVVVATAQQLLEHLVRAHVVVGDAEVADLPGCLPFPQRPRVRREVEQVVHLHEVDAVSAQEAEGILHLPHAGVAARGPDFRRQEERLRDAELGGEIADHPLGPAVHWRAVDDRAARLHEEPQHVGERRAVRAGRADIERAIGAESDRGEQLARLRDLPLQHWLSSPCGAGTQCRQHAGRHQLFQRRAPGDARACPGQKGAFCCRSHLKCTPSSSFPSGLWRRYS